MRDFLFGKVLKMNFFLQIFGIGIGYFAIRIFLRQFFITTTAMTKIVSGFFLIQWFAFHFSVNFFLLMMLNVVYVGGIFFSILIFHKIREIRFRYSFPEFLTSVILQMKIGKSFRSSYQNALTTLPRYQKETLEQIYQNVAFWTQENDKKMTTERSFSGFLMEELLKIDRSQHKTIEKLENFRGRLITANNFRRRSGRIRENIYVQVSIMGFFYVIAFAYTIMTAKFSQIQDVLVISTALFLTGTLMAFWIGRKIKWTI
jgi:hypothetical protein